jgi:hypothetical protein
MWDNYLSAGPSCGVTAPVVEPADADAQVAVDPAQESGDLHLGDADVLGYLTLGQAAQEPQLQDAAVSLAEPEDERLQGDAGLRQVRRTSPWSVVLGPA